MRMAWLLRCRIGEEYAKRLVHRVGIGDSGLDGNPIEDCSQVRDDFGCVAVPWRMSFLRFIETRQSFVKRLAEHRLYSNGLGSAVCAGKRRVHTHGNALRIEHLKLSSQTRRR